MKFASLKSLIGFFVKVKEIFNLSAPGAAKLVNPFALSYNDSSSLEPTNNSSTLKPILYVGVFV